MSRTLTIELTDEEYRAVEQAAQANDASIAEWAMRTLRGQLPFLAPSRHHEADSETGDWPPGFFEETYGSLADDPLERLPQGAFDVRERLR